MMRSTIIILTLLSVTNGRQRFKMDFDWKFNLGETEWNNCTITDFPINMNSMECSGLIYNQHLTNNSFLCKQTCCGDPKCVVYQWCSQGNTDCNNGTKGPSCYIGYSTNNCVKSKGWITMARKLSPIQGPIDPKYDDSKWVTRNIPHDFISGTGAFDENNDGSHGYLPKNTSWYRKHFSLDSSFKGQKLWIDFDGVYRDSDAWVNGVHLGNHQSGYTSFRYYIDQIPNLEYGSNSDNVLVMRVNPALNEGHWYEGGGIYRHVWLTAANRIHIKPWGIYAGSNVTKVTNNRYGDAILNVQTNVTYNLTESTAVIVSLQTDIISKTNGQKIATNTQTGIKLNAGNEILISQQFILNNVLLWSIQNPELHVIHSTILDENNNVIDSVSTIFGFRKVYFDSNKGLYLNEQYVKGNGFCNHQDFAGSGAGTPERINRFRIQSLQQVGANLWRMSHNPPNPELLDFMDEYGMLVWNENRNFADNSQYLMDIRDMIQRDKNHPSIIVWSLCNENGCMEGDPKAGNVSLMFQNVIRRIDNFNTRPISAAMNKDLGDKMSPTLDVQGINYQENTYDTYHSAHPNQALISSENRVAETARGEYQNNNTAGHSTSYANVSQAWLEVEERSFISGVMFWTGFDYKGEPQPYWWPEINSQYGIFDIAGFKKDVYWYYRARWQQDNESILYIVPNDWNQWKQGAKVNVWVYGNVAYVDLQLNGKSVSNGMKSITSAIPNIFSVIYAPGILNAIGYDAKKNNIVNYTLSTSDVPYAIELIITYPGNTIYCDGQDVALIEVRIVDVTGIRVPYASNMIDFSISGDGIIYGVGNGDNASHEPDKANSRSVFHGLARVIVQSLLNKPGEMILTASSKGLLSKSVTIYTVPNPEQMFYV